MRFGCLCAVALLLLSGAVQAQEQQAPTACTGLAPDSFEAAVLSCDQAAQSLEPRVPPRALEVLEEVPLTEPSRPVRVLRPGESGGPLAELHAESPEVVQLSAGSASRRALSSRLAAPEAEPEPIRILQVPDGQRPPAGSCRVWFPDRHEGLQRPPTSCDVEVPDGAFLIRG